MKLIFQIILFLFPWCLRRILLNKFLKYNIHKKSKIGFSIILSNKLIMEPNSSIGNLTFCKKIDLLKISSFSSIGALNFITGFESVEQGFADCKKHFKHVQNRKCELIIDEHSAITSRHFIDVNGGVYIGKFTTVAGLRTQILTHSIDILENRQDAKPVKIGDYCFIGTNCILIKGATIPDYSIIGAHSLVNKNLKDEYSLYGGVPARKIKSFKDEKKQPKYFSRENGFVN